MQSQPACWTEHGSRPRQSRLVASAIGLREMGMGQEVNAEVRFAWSANGKAGHVREARSPERVNDDLGLKGLVDLNVAITSRMPSCDLRYTFW